jgi:AcrR family transcriptional regulator
MNKKQLLLNSALELFVEQDINKTSTASVAKNAGVSNGTLFHYFPTKNDLVIELYLQLKEEMFEYIYSDKVASAHNLKQMIGIGWMNAVQWICSNPLKHNFIHKIYTTNYKALIEDDQLPESYLRYLKMIEEGIMNKELIPIPLELMASIINGFVNSLAEYYIMKGLDPDESLNTIVFEMTWNSIKNKD